MEAAASPLDAAYGTPARPFLLSWLDAPAGGLARFRRRLPADYPLLCTSCFRPASPGGGSVSSGIYAARGENCTGRMSFVDRLFRRGGLALLTGLARQPQGTLYARAAPPTSAQEKRLEECSAMGVQTACFYAGKSSGPARRPRPVKAKLILRREDLRDDKAGSARKKPAAKRHHPRRRRRFAAQSPSVFCGSCFFFVVLCGASGFPVDIYELFLRSRLPFAVALTAVLFSALPAFVPLETRPKFTLPAFALLYGLCVYLQFDPVLRDGFCLLYNRTVLSLSRRAATGPF